MKEIMALFQTLLYLISSVLFYPVVVLLVLMFFYMVYKLGVLAGEFFKRSKSLINTYEDMVNGFLIKDPDEADVHKFINDFEDVRMSEIEFYNLFIRISPSLGLMGTLIPMGVGLAALSKGEVEKLAANLIVAFTTTVVGLAIAVIAYFISFVKKRWLWEDLKLIEYMLEKKYGKVYEKKDKEATEY